MHTNTGSTRVPTEVEVVAVEVEEETGWVETDLEEEVVDAPDSVVEEVAVDGLDLLEVRTLHHTFLFLIEFTDCHVVQFLCTSLSFTAGGGGGGGSTGADSWW